LSSKSSGVTVAKALSPLNFEMGTTSVDLPVTLSVLVAATSMPLVSLTMTISGSFLLVKI
jgi:hypothetical protein